MESPEMPPNYPAVREISEALPLPAELQGSSGSGSAPEPAGSISNQSQRSRDVLLELTGHMSYVGSVAPPTVRTVTI
jgi:hypothetical protein